MSRYQQVQAELKKNPRTWLVTGIAGFIGSNLLEKLLLLDQKVIGLDNCRPPAKSSAPAFAVRIK